MADVKAVELARGTQRPALRRWHHNMGHNNSAVFKTLLVDDSRGLYYPIYSILCNGVLRRRARGVLGVDCDMVDCGMVRMVDGRGS